MSGVQAFLQRCLTVPPATSLRCPTSQALRGLRTHSVYRSTNDNSAAATAMLQLATKALDAWSDS